MSDLYELPNGWKWKKLNEVFIVKDGTHDSPKYIIENGYPLFTSKNLKENGLDKDNYKLISEDDYNKINHRSKVDKGDLLFAMIGTIGNPTIIDYEPNFAIKNVALFKHMDENNLIELLRYYFLSNTVMDKMLSEAKGATQKFVGLTYLRNFPFPSIPLSEQQRIVSKLDLIFEKIDKSIALHQKNMDEADVFMGSILNDVFGELEEKYGKQSLSTVVKINSGIALPKIFKDKETTIGEFEFFKVAQMNNDDRVMKGADLNFTKEESINHKIKLFPKGSILIPKRGGAILTNKKRILEREASYDSNVMGLKADNKILSDEFLFVFLNSIDLSDYIDTSTIPQINNKHIDMMNISIPPLHIQQKVVNYLDKISEKIEKIKSIQKEKMDGLKALKASILDKAFRGEL